MGIEYSPQLAEICGIHAGDGYLRNDGKRRELDISGALYEKEYYDAYVVPLFEQVFGINISPKYFPARRTYGFVIYGKKIAEFMHSLGFPYGNKTFSVSAPDFILRSKDPDIIYAFIRGVFDTDGCLSFQLKYNRKQLNTYPLIKLGVCSKPLIDNVADLLSATGFHFSRLYLPPTYGYQKPKYGVILRGNDALRLWMHNIGFKNPSKLSRYEIWFKHGFCPPNTSYEQRKQILNNELDPNTFYTKGSSLTDKQPAFGAGDGGSNPSEPV